MDESMPASPYMPDPQKTFVKQMPPLPRHTVDIKGKSILHTGYLHIKDIPLMLGTLQLIIKNEIMNK